MLKRVYFVVAGLLFGSPAYADISAGLEAINANDYVKAAKAFEAAYEAGEADGAFYLGRMMELGAGAEKNVALAARLYREAGDQGSALALNRLGLLYIEGQGVLKDPETGAKLICEAAEMGNADAAFNCGTIYIEGKGVDASEDKALSYWQQAADGAHIGAQNILGQVYLNGSLVALDKARAKSYFEKTAARGNAMGLYELGALLAGSDSRSDMVEAHSLFNLAAARQHPLAADARDTLEGQLSATEIAEAIQKARNWTPKAE